ncbi:uncharacterized protein METZ01_LOCUS68668 [marine metagenome]|uniref:Uncharacterized protein n=1 Tax=marine metagenome TaxID=408172 RepID=A0A381TJ73_9ZZZZ
MVQASEGGIPVANEPPGPNWYLPTKGISSSKHLRTLLPQQSGNSGKMNELLPRLISSIHSSSDLGLELK